MQVGFSRLPFLSPLLSFSLLYTTSPRKALSLQSFVMVGQTTATCFLSVPPFGFQESLRTFSRVMHPPWQRSPSDQERRICGGERGQKILPQDHSQGFCGGPVVRSPTYSAGDTGSIPAQERLHMQPSLCSTITEPVLQNPGATTTQARAP